MTGYGRATLHHTLGTFVVELRSTNHRYLEIEQRLQNGLAPLQRRVAEMARSCLHRGRIELTATAQLTRGEHRNVVLDEPLLRRYHEALVRLQARFGLKGPVALEHLLGMPHAVTITEDHVPSEQLWEPLSRVTEAALRELVRSRRREGMKLAADLRRQLQAIERHIRAIKRRMPKALEQQRRQLKRRLQEVVGSDVFKSVSQLEQAAVLVKEADIHEELVRLDSHLAYMRQTLASDRLIGKRLDFIAQELVRETNTMGAKVNDPQAVQRAVEIKSCIEKIREQVQNLE